ncbi:MAG: tetratricopeptide (TPR) repeat protein [Alphaproteobacteria bacterium]|jgi:tetratricopeptide (TPR) repeat protein
MFGDPNQINKEILVETKNNAQKIDRNYIENKKIQNSVEILSNKIRNGDELFATANQYLHDNNEFKAEMYFSSARNKYNTSLNDFKISEEQKQYVTGKIIASYFGSGEYEDGLIFLCRRYEEIPKNDYRYRHDAHALIRMLSYKHSFDTAREVIKRLETHHNCKRNDINIIWSAIPLEVMRRLDKSVTEVNVGCSSKEEIKNFECLRPEDIDLLQTIIKKQPLNPLIDYAIYTLADYKKIIKNKPNSYLYDTALLAQAERLRTKKQYTKSNLVIDQYITKYPNGPRIKKVYELKFENFIDVGAIAEAEKIKDEFKIYKDNSLLSDIFSSHHGRKIIKYFNEGQLHQAYKILSKIILNKTSSSDTIKIINDLKSTMFRYSNLYKNLEVDKIKNLSKLFTSCGYDRNKFKYIKSSKNKRDCIFILSNLGDKVHFHSAAANINKWIYQRTNDGDTLFLTALMYKQNKEYENYLENLEKFISLRDSQIYLDDAFTELGWYQMVFQKKYKQAEKNFLHVVNNFSSHNSYDNALNWLIILYKNQGRYGKALEFSYLLTKNIVSTRLLPKIKGRRFDIQEGVELNRDSGFSIGVIDDWNSYVWGYDDHNKYVVIYKNDTANKNILVGSIIEYVLLDHKKRQITSVKHLLSILKRLKNNSITEVIIGIQSDKENNSDNSIVKVSDFGV